jgi:hypothetical protein
VRRAAVVSVAVACLVSTACDPEVMAWWSAQRDEAAAKGLPCADHAALINVVGLPEVFHYVAEAETGGTCRHDLINPRSGATGLFQVLPHLWADDCGTTRHGLLDGFTNAVCAAHIYDVQGAEAWSQTWPW